MDPQFQELANEIADAVEKRLSGTFEDRIATQVEKRLSGAFEDRIATQVENRLSGAFEERIKTHIDQFEKRADASFKQHIDKFEERAELRMKMHFENLESNVTLAAEGYGATLDGIKQELENLNKNVDTRFGDHDRVLHNHNERITKLETR
jgi:hypothetical protein